MSGRAAAALAAGLLGLAAIPPPVGAGELDDVLAGFEDEPAAAAWEPSPAPASRRWGVSGRLSLESAANLRQDRSPYEGLAKLRTELRLQLDGELPRAWKLRLGGRGWYDAAYLAQGRGDFPRDVLDAYELEAEVWESWIAGPLGERVNLKIGREIATFGTSETLRVVDALLPIDNREPGAADLEDLYLPELHARADALLAGVELTAIAILERRFSELPPAGSSYLPPGPPLAEERAHWKLDAPELLVSGRHRVGSVDLGVIGAWAYADWPTLELDDSARGGLRRIHDRVWMLGAVGVRASGNWVLRGELAGFGGLSFANEPDRAYRRLDALVGVDYVGRWDLAIAVDVVHRWLPSAPRSIERAPDFAERSRMEYALRIHRSFLRERLRLTAVGVVFGLDGDAGALARLQVDYAFDDSLSLTVGLLYYHSGDLPPTSALGRNDRVFAALRYRF